MIHAAIDIVLCAVLGFGLVAAWIACCEVVRRIDARHAQARLRLAAARQAEARLTGRYDDDTHGGWPDDLCSYPPCDWEDNKPCDVHAADRDHQPAGRDEWTADMERRWTP